MSKKYELVDQHPETGLWRIRALRDFADVKAGDLGGWISRTHNLSQERNCWIYDNAIVMDSARVEANAKIRNNAKIFDNARIFNSAQVFDNAKVYENSLVMDNIKIYGKARVRGEARIFEKAQVYDNAQVYGNVTVTDDARVFGNAKVFGHSLVAEDSSVYDNAMVSGNSSACGYSRIFGQAELYDKARVGESQRIKFDMLKTDITEGRNIEDSLRCQLNMTFDENDEVLCYKTVKSNLTSLRAQNFQYRVGEWAVAKNPDMSTASCAPGLHFSYKGYWSKVINVRKDTVDLLCRVKKEDIITIQDGKIRAKKAFVIRVD